MAVGILLLVTVTLCLAFSKHRLLPRLLGGTGLIVSGLVGIASCVRVLYQGSTISFSLGSLNAYFGELAFELDPLSAFFAGTLLFISVFVGFYGIGYTKSDHGDGRSWAWLNLLVLSMFLVFISRNALCFLLSWELMSLSSFFLVLSEHRRDRVRVAAWVYLVASHLGTALIILFFLLLGSEGNTLQFVSFHNPAGVSASLLFGLAFLGFGTKAGIIPLHVWLPEAHPAAPSHVSAIMSGIMVKVGIYGFLRALTMIKLGELWWGWTVLGVGMVSGLLGVLFAIAQHDLKRLLAYHTVENVGIIYIGIGVGNRFCIGSLVADFNWRPCPCVLYQGIRHCLSGK